MSKEDTLRELEQNNGEPKLEIKPYNRTESKKEEVREMFDAIAPKYDLLNHLLSMNIDRSWRRKLVSMVHKQNPATLLDIATGTGDLAIAIKRKLPSTTVIGSDLSPEMVEIGRQKVKKKELEIKMCIADAEKLEFSDESFQAVTAAFGVRNFGDLQKGIDEMYRVLKVGGEVYILEFSMPKRSFFASLYKFYFLKILPLIGRLISRDSRAYRYLPESVEAFPAGEDFLEILTTAGFKEGRSRSLTFGVATIYSAVK